MINGIDIVHFSYTPITYPNKSYKNEISPNEMCI
jgi:hypothetical protein